jgi:hypothetical protein
MRRLERVMVGAVMAVIAVVLEKLVLRALRKKGETPLLSEPTQVTTRGGAIEFDPER